MIQLSQPYLTFGSVHLFRITHYKIDKEPSPLKFPVYYKHRKFIILRIKTNLEPVFCRMNSAISQKAQVKNAWQNMHTDLTDSGPINLESSHSDIVCEIYLLICLWRKLISKPIAQIRILERYLITRTDQLFLSPFLGSVLLIGVMLFQDNYHHMLDDYYLWVIWKLLRYKTMQLNIVPHLYSN